MPAFYYFSISIISFTFIIILTLLFAGRGFKNSNLYLGLVLLNFLSVCLAVFFMDFEPGLYVKYFIGFEYVTSYWFAPALLLFTRANLGLPVNLRSTWKHYILPFIILLLFLSYQFLPVPFKNSFAQQAIQYRNPVFRTLDLIYYLYFFAYMFRSLQLSYKPTGSFKTPYLTSFLETRRRFTRSVLWCILIFGALSIVFGFIENGKYFARYIIINLFLSSFYCVVYNALANPGIFKRFGMKDIMADTPKNSPPVHELDSINQKLLELVSQNGFLSDPYLSVEKTASLLNVSRKNLTAAITRFHGISFIDFINRHRIEKAREILASPESSKYTIDSITTVCGFSCRASFYNAFRKHAGLTPARYRESVRNQSRPL